MFSLITHVLRTGVNAGDPQEIQPVDPIETAAALVAGGLFLTGLGIAAIGAGLSVGIQERRVPPCGSFDCDEEEVPHVR